jgi:hypothetical protein
MLRKTTTIIIIIQYLLDVTPQFSDLGFNRPNFGVRHFCKNWKFSKRSSPVRKRESGQLSPPPPPREIIDLLIFWEGGGIIDMIKFW